MTISEVSKKYGLPVDTLRYYEKVGLIPPVHRKESGVCNNTHACVQKDGMKPLLDKMVEADVIVLATPVYFYSMDGQLKTFIDRTVPRYTEIADKDFYFILSAADTEKKNMARTLEALRGFTQDCLDGAREKGVIYGVGVWQKGEVKNTPAYKEAYEAGKNC